MMSIKNENISPVLARTGFAFGLFLVLQCLAPSAALAEAPTIQALRMAGMITGGAIPATDPVFTTMVSDIQAGNYVAAAQAAVNSSYFAGYLPRRMARQMMNSHLSETGVFDSDASLFIVANLLGLATTASISKLWSQKTRRISLMSPSMA